MDTNSLLQHLERGGIVLTATERLARDVSMRLATHFATKGSSFKAANVLSLSRFFHQRIEARHFPVCVLSPLQTHTLFARAIEDTGPDLLNASPMAQEAIQAVRYCHEANHDPMGIDDDSDETQAFQAWTSAAMAQRADYHRFESEIMPLLLAEDDTQYWPKNIMTLGDMPSSPVFRLLIEQAGDNAVQFSRGADERVAAVSGVRHLTPEDELQWLGQRLRDDLAGNANQRIGVAVAGLSAHRDALERVLIKHLHQGFFHQTSSEQVRPFKIMQGTPLIKEELISSAFSVLSLSAVSNDLSVLQSLLMSDRLAGNGDERVGRANAELVLRRWGNASLSLQALLKATELNAPVLHRRLVAYSRALAKHNRAVYPSMWARRFRRRLKLIGWPGNAAWSAREYQAMSQWLDQLDEMATMDHVFGKVNQGRALMILRQLCAQRLFLEKPKVNPPIEVMDLFDVAGHDYDRLYVINARSSECPRAVTANSLLPLSWQEEQGFVHASATLRLEEATRTQEALTLASNELVLSCATQTSTGQWIHPSSVLHDGWEEFPLMEAGVEEGDRAIEELHTNALPLRDDEQPSGGVKIVSLFQKQPFYSFAVSRLRLREMPSAHEGLTAATQGDLVHGVMEHFWGEVNNHASLLRLTEGEQSELIERSFSLACDQVKGLPYRFAQSHMARWELDRIKRITARFLFVERQREPFEVIHTELPIEVTIKGIVHSLRIDRVDRLSDGSVVFIDYKTSRYVDTKGWNPDGLTEPQLPIYAVSTSNGLIDGESPRGIALAQLSDEGCGFKCWTDQGVNFVAEKNKRISVNELDWSECLTRWNDAIDTTLTGFVSGDLRYTWEELSQDKFEQHLHVLMDDNQ